MATCPESCPCPVTASANFWMFHYCLLGTSKHLSMAHSLAYVLPPMLVHLVIYIVLIYFYLHAFVHGGPSAWNIHPLLPSEYILLKSEFVEVRASHPLHYEQLRAGTGKDTFWYILFSLSYSIQFSFKINWFHDPLVVANCGLRIVTLNLIYSNCKLGRY